MDRHDPPLTLAVVGATATGKTALAEALAAELSAEVICADSRQVFGELEIGTGKPTPRERAQAPHHLFEALTLEQRPTAGWYGRAAGTVRAEVRSRGRLPLLVGGSGLYLRAAQGGLAPAPPRDPEVRAQLEAELATQGPQALHARLAQVDPAAAGRIAPRDRQRILRALEVEQLSGRPLSWWLAQPAPAAAKERWLLLELELPTTELDRRVTARTRWMMDHGLSEEVQGLLDAGLGQALRDLRAVGYDETLDLLSGAIDRETAESRIDLRTRQLAKRQRTWFRHQTVTHRLDGRAPLEVLRAQALDLWRDELASRRDLSAR